MNSDALQETQGKSRQDQILLLAAEGMTDKEIAARLQLSPETVGTYWRRILSKYSAASRTEVVAKVVRLQAEANINQVNEVMECLQTVTDHLLLELSGRQPHSLDANTQALLTVLGRLSSHVILVDGEGFVSYFNRPIPGVALELNTPFEWMTEGEDRDAVRTALAATLENSHVESDLMISPVGSNGSWTARIFGVDEAEPPMVGIELRPTHL